MARQRKKRAPEYLSWASMKQRCLNPKSDRYADYGGRGITVCLRWQRSYEAFLKDMGPRPAGTSLERRENDKGYSPANCYWATQLEQNRNRRSWGKSQYRGVYFHTATGKWMARITVGGRLRFLGRHANEQDAARAYDVVARESFGTNAQLNFPIESKAA